MAAQSVRSAIPILVGALLALAGTAVFVWVISATAFEPWVSILASAVVPIASGFVAVRGGMETVHVLTWAVASFLLVLLAFLSLPHPVSYLTFPAGLGLPLLMVSSSQMRTAWYRFILRVTDQEQ